MNANEFDLEMRLVEALRQRDAWKSTAACRQRCIEEDAEKLKSAKRFLDAWDRAESGRGCYSCSPAHDCRCDKDRNIGDCTCGRDELEAASTALTLLLQPTPEEE